MVTSLELELEESSNRIGHLSPFLSMTNCYSTTAKHGVREIEETAEQAYVW